MQRGGVLIRVSARDGGRFVLVPAALVRGIFVLPSITPVEGLRAPAVGMALVNGEVVTVFSLDEEGLSSVSRNESSTAVLCDLGAEPIAIVGRSIDAAGLFDDVRPGVVRVGQSDAEVLDVAALRRAAEDALWAMRVGMLRPVEIVT